MQAQIALQSSPTLQQSDNLPIVYLAMFSHPVKAAPQPPHI